MRTKSRCKIKSISLQEKLAELKVNKIAVETGFEFRKPKKISGVNLITGFFDCCFGHSFSLTNWAAKLSVMTKQTISKQAIAGRVNERFITLLEKLIATSISQNIAGRKNKLLNRFANVYIQDSTCLFLPDVLVGSFKGNYSKGKIKSVAKLQAIFNITQGFFSHLSLSAYSRNDQQASGDIITILKKGDLVIRDMGYFVLDRLSAIMKKEAHFITRLRAEVLLIDARTHKLIHLNQVLKGKTFFKKKILLGKEQKIPVTLFAIKTSNAIWEHRKYKMHKDRNKRLKVTIEKLNLAGWDIFVSSLNDLTGKEIKEVYRVRWQIEIIFKSWKSHLKLEKNISRHLKKPQLFYAIVYLALLMVILIIMPVYRMIKTKARNGISLLKLTQLIVTILPKQNWILSSKYMDFIAYYSAYDQRKRQNSMQKLQLLS
jgi:hypothetical protein